MKHLKFFLPALAFLLFTGCGDVNWFPDNGQNASISGGGAYVATKAVTASDEHVYHYPEHGTKIIHVENQIWFATAAEAVASGRRPCRICNPPTQ